MNEVILVPGLKHILERDEAVMVRVRRTAEQIAEEARAIAPVATGAYRDSIHVEQEETAAGVVADVPYAVFVEFGTSDTPAFAPLRRAAEPFQ